MEAIKYAFINGAVSGSFCTALFIFGFIWRLRVLSALRSLIFWLKRKRRRPKLNSAANRNRKGFGIAPVLYLLGLIGIASGVLFSGFFQSFVSMMQIQNRLAVRNDLMGASTTLAAQSVFSADNTTLCPPRSVHQSNGDPCAAAPVGLVLFLDFTAPQRLPTNYANVASTGNPTEVGVFAVGAIKQLDSFGHAYIYCRWEQTRASPASPAFVIISAGADGILQTRCGDTEAQGDNLMISSPVAQVVGKASLWQPDGTTDVAYGAAGTQTVVDASGNINAAGTVTANAGDFATLHVTGTSQVDGVATFGNYVGIGTATPTSALDITGATGTQTLMLGPYAGSGGAVIQFNGTNSGVLTTSRITSSYTGGLELYAPQGVGVSQSASFNPLGGASLQVQGNVAIGSGYTNMPAPANGAIIQGSVGIGTPNPSRLLSLYSTGPVIGLTDVASGSEDTITNSGGLLSFNTGANNTILFNTGTSEKMRIQGGTGNVGLGTATPQSALSVNGGVAIGATYAGTNAAGTNNLTVQGGIAIGVNGVTTGRPLQASQNMSGLDASIYFTNGVAGKGEYLYLLSNASNYVGINIAGNQNWYIGQWGITNFILRDNNNGALTPFSVETSTPSNTLYLKSNGNVGIGTNAPASMLSVNGTASLAGALTGTSATFSGAVTAGSFSLSSLATLSGGATVTGGVLTAGTTSLGVTTASSLNLTSGNYQIGGVQIAASNLSNGTTGSGAIALATSPALTGSPTAPTQTTGDNSGMIATDAFVTTAVANKPTGFSSCTTVSSSSGAVSCSGGYTMTGGGCQSLGVSTSTYTGSSYPSSANTWTCSANGSFGNTYAICCH